MFDLIPHLPWFVHALVFSMGATIYNLSYRKLKPEQNAFAFAVSFEVIACLLATFVAALMAWRGEALVLTVQGFLGAAVVGFLYGLLNLGFVMFYKSGGQASVCVPIVRVGSLTLTTTIGLVILGEAVTITKLAGIVCVVVGILFITTSPKKPAFP